MPAGVRYILYELLNVIVSEMPHSQFHIAKQRQIKLVCYA